LLADLGMGIALINIKMINTLRSCFVCLTYVCTVHCFVSSTVAICSPGKSLTKSKEVFILEVINMRAESKSLKRGRGS